MPVATLSMSAAATARVKKPRTRGAFQPLDAARRQLGLLTVADRAGQCRIYWLVDVSTQVIEDSRFLAFGTLASHALGDVFTETVRGRTISDACMVRTEQLEALLRDDPLTPAFAEPLLEIAAFIDELQRLALAEVPALALLPKPAEADAYQRKRQQDWTDADRAWLPRKLLDKVATVDAIVGATLRARQADGVSARIDGLHDDFRVVLALPGASAASAPTLARFIEDALRAQLHPQLAVELAAI